MFSISQHQAALRPMRSSPIALIAIAVLFVASHPARGGTFPTGDPDYRAALRTCQFWKGHRADRARTSPSDPYVSRCLQRKGWTAEGLPQSVFESLRELPAERGRP